MPSPLREQPLLRAGLATLLALFLACAIAGLAGSCASPQAATVAVTGVAVSPANATLSVGSTLSLSAAVEPANATDASLSWSSDAPTVARVSSAGLVTALKAGRAIIVATTTDGAKTASCAVEVTSSLGVTSYSLRWNDGEKLTYVYAEVSNADAIGYGSVKVSYELYNATGTLLGSGSDYPKILTVPAGRSYPFIATSTVKRSLIDRATFKLSYLNTNSDDPEKDLAAKDLAISTDSYGQVQADGKILNAGSSPKENCEILFIFYDAAKSIVSIDRAPKQAVTIAAGASYGFTLLTTLAPSEYSSYRTIVDSMSNY
jgi:Bacterial surface proteins containing Ig-like domains